VKGKVIWTIVGIIAFLAVLVFIATASVFAPTNVPSHWRGLSGHITNVQIGSSAYIENGTTGFWRASPLSLFEYQGISDGAYIIHLDMADKTIYLPTSAKGYTVVQRINGGTIFVYLTNISTNADGSMSFDWDTAR